MTPWKSRRSSLRSAFRAPHTRSTASRKRVHGVTIADFARHARHGYARPRRLFQPRRCDVRQRRLYRFGPTDEPLRHPVTKINRPLAELLRPRDGAILMRALRWIAAGAIAAGAAWISFDLLYEVYGAGPPHYGRTANMDKWVSPWPVVLVVDALAVAVLIGLLVPWRRRRKNSD